MDYTNMIKNTENKKSKVGVIGATRGYGYTLLAQIPHVKHMDLRVICSRHPEDCRKVLEEIGYLDAQIKYCKNQEEIDAVPEEEVIIVSDYHLVERCGITALVECTGNTMVSAEAALSALRKGINVYMVSKETDSVCGPLLNQVAVENHAVYALVNGDQPRNLIDLYSWAMLLGLEVIVAGKASEYDFVWDREKETIVCTDGSSAEEYMPDIKDCWHYEGAETLKRRKDLLGKYTSVISADLCEMNLVSNITGLSPSSPFLNYPIARTSELADIFIPKENGGILEHTGIVDVFYCLRDKDEASFCGGEFIVVKCENEKMWEILKSKGHILSKNNKYACIYYPYHYMGLETPISILLGDFMGIGVHPECQQNSIMVGMAQRDLNAGTTLKVEGHHHAIDGLIPQLLESDQAEKMAPFYLLNCVKLKNDIKKGSVIMLEDVEFSQKETYELFIKSRNLK